MRPRKSQPAHNNPLAPIQLPKTRMAIRAHIGLASTAVADTSATRTNNETATPSS